MNWSVLNLIIELPTETLRATFQQKYSTKKTLLIMSVFKTGTGLPVHFLLDFPMNWLKFQSSCSFSWLIFLAATLLYMWHMSSASSVCLSVCHTLFGTFLLVRDNASGVCCYWVERLVGWTFFGVKRSKVTVFRAKNVKIGRKTSNLAH